MERKPEISSEDPSEKSILNGTDEIGAEEFGFDEVALLLKSGFESFEHEVEKDLLLSP